MPEELLPIGRFARLCRLSVKQLRHYDTVGLLPPAEVDAPVWGLFPVDFGAQIRVAVGVESAGSAPGTSVEHLPAGLAAVATHLGPYEHLALTYHAVFAWIHEHGLRPGGIAREAYLTDPTTGDPAHLATRVVIPVDDEEQ